MGTRINGVPITKVVDGDTLNVKIDGKTEKLRLACMDTEESQPGGDKPVTKAGKDASAMAKAYFAAGGGFANVDLEFDTEDPVEVCMDMHRDNFGRLLCYVHKGGENFNLKLVREGWSPYFVKYGRSRVYHTELAEAEAEAQAHNRVIWDVEYNAGGNMRDYTELVPWWALRDSVVEDYRRALPASGVLSVRLDYQQLREMADAGEEATIFCDLQGGVNQWTGGGALIYAGSPFHKFNLWIPDAEDTTAQRIINLIKARYAEQGRGYVYVSGTVSKYRGTPQIVLSDFAQLKDFPPP